MTDVSVFYWWGSSQSIDKTVFDFHFRQCKRLCSSSETIERPFQAFSVCKYSYQRQTNKCILYGIYLCFRSNENCRRHHYSHLETGDNLNNGKWRIVNERREAKPIANVSIVLRSIQMWLPRDLRKCHVLFKNKHGLT